ncbi:MAG: DUF3667 domain-containing protein [Bacteroidota bacterium]
MSSVISPDPSNEPSPSEVDRISMSTIWQYLLGVINLDRGLPFTIWQYLRRPKRAVYDFLESPRRKNYTKPFAFLLIVGVVGTYISFSLLDQLTTAQGGMLEKGLRESAPDLEAALKEFMEFLRKYQHFVQFGIIPILTLATQAIYRERKLNYAEHLVINSYVTGMRMLASSLGLLLTMLADSLPLALFGSALAIAYTLYAYYTIFGPQKDWIVGILKGVAVYVCSVVVSSLVQLLLVLIFLWDVLWAHLQAQ